MAYLLNRGYRDIRVVSQLPEVLLYDDFREAYENEIAGCTEAMAAAGLKFDPHSIVRWPEQTEECGYREMKKLLQRPDRPRAIFINHDILTRGALLAVYELGLKIPQDIVLLTHFNEGNPIVSPVELTRLVYNPRLVVDSVLNDVLAQLRRETPEPGESRKQVDGCIVPGKSCGE
ncbi:HTH-type transcriptional repressor PurR [bioreactor metagenome]|uniref:HTH-type transcriptional repressor PurR n=1 Tax=bioreactor metagenome TaxID=1076179 RepID=A0A645GVX2_9ZZZZ